MRHIGILSYTLLGILWPIIHVTRGSAAQGRAGCCSAHVLICTRCALDDTCSMVIRAAIFDVSSWVRFPACVFSVSSRFSLLLPFLSMERLCFWHLHPMFFSWCVIVTGFSEVRINDMQGAADQLLHVCVLLLVGSACIVASILASICCTVPDPRSLEGCLPLCLLSRHDVSGHPNAVVCVLLGGASSVCWFPTCCGTPPSRAFCSCLSHVVDFPGKNGSALCHRSLSVHRVGGCSRGLQSIPRPDARHPAACGSHATPATPQPSSPTTQPCTSSFMAGWPRSSMRTAGDTPPRRRWRRISGQRSPLSDPTQKGGGGGAGGGGRCRVPLGAAATRPSHPTPGWSPQSEYFRPKVSHDIPWVDARVGLVAIAAGGVAVAV